MRVIVLRRPPLPWQHVSRQAHCNGPYGLRRAVERLLPEYFTLHSGLTTGTCATAAAIAATRRLTTGQEPAEVSVTLPDGESIAVAVGYGDGYAYCTKEAGDDPDVTDGLEIRATAEPSDHFSIDGGQGVGRFTLPGFDYAPGEAAINRGPRQMMRANIHRCTSPSACPAERRRHCAPSTRGWESWAASASSVSRASSCPSQKRLSWPASADACKWHGPAAPTAWC